MVARSKRGLSSGSGRGGGVPGALGWEVSVGGNGLYGGWSSSGFSVFRAGCLVSWGQWGFVWVVVLGFVLLDWYYQIIIKSVHKETILY